MDLIVGTLALRPYVFGFLAAFLAAGAADLGWRHTLLFGGIVWPVAWLGEFASTRVGIPFGRYHYTGLTRGRELYVADVPLMDSLSFAFLAYAAFCLARATLARRRPSGGSLALLSGALMMALDVVIDPLAVRGDRWFLERIFYYPAGGVYFGVPLSNFAGWVVVGTAGVGLYLTAARTVGAVPARPPRGRAGLVWPGIALYYAVLGFNLAMTIWIGEWWLAGLGGLLHAAVALALRFVHRHAVPGEVPGAGSRGLQRT